MPEPEAMLLPVPVTADTIKKQMKRQRRCKKSERPLWGWEWWKLKRLTVLALAKLHKTGLFTIDRHDIDNERRTFSKDISRQFLISREAKLPVTIMTNSLSTTVSVHQHIIGTMAPETPPCASWALHHPPAEVKRTEWTHILPSAKAGPDSARGWISATTHLSNWLRRIWLLHAACMPLTSH